MSETTFKYNWQTDRKYYLNRVINWGLHLFHTVGLKPENQVRLGVLQSERQFIEATEQSEKLAEREAKSRDMKNRVRRGKHTEKKLAQDIHGIKKGGPHREDINAGLFSIEAKHQKRFLARMEKGLAEAQRHKGRDQIAIYVEKVGRQARVYLDWNDWLELHGK